MRAAIAILVASLIAAPACARDLSGPARVIDGDTIVIGQEHVRLTDGDALELGQVCHSAVWLAAPWPCGQRATQALADLVSGEIVTCERKGVDRYGRTLADCWIGGLNLMRWMVVRGWAMVDRRYGQRFLSEERGAKLSGAGAWSGEFEMPWLWRGK